MSDRKLHSKAYSEWREQAADEYVQAQRRAFLDGFETAAREGEEFALLREWLEDKRDEAAERHEQTEDSDDLAQRMAYINVLVKLSEMGCRPEEDDSDE